jgi:hypothetical protein
VKSLRKQIIACALVIGSGTLLAQPTESPSDRPTAAAIQLSEEDMIRDLPGMISRVDEDVQIVQGLQIRARREKDVIKLNCINDKLLQIRALRNALDKDRAAFEGAAVLDEQRDLFTAISGHASEIRALREQAQVCAGEAELQTDSRADWQGPDIPDDPSVDLFPDGIEQPGYASPFN